MNSLFQDLSYGILHFSVAQIFNDYDKIIVWYCIPRCNLNIFLETKTKTKNLTKFFSGMIENLWCILMWRSEKGF